MDVMTRIEQALETAMAGATGAQAPPRLAAALRHAVFPPGHRIRPRLCLAVARACGDGDPAAADAAAAAIELLHCASLVHDDLPCFDDAALRRGKPTVHIAFGEELAVLCGDALIVLAFEALARGTAADPARLAPLLLTITAAVGMPAGITAGQAWESEPAVDLSEYHRAKTGVLFAAAAMCGAAAAGFDPAPWRIFGATLGEAYQVADDISDMAATADLIGKPVGQDLAHARASAVRELGLGGALERLDRLADAAVAAVPPCPGARPLKDLVRLEARRFLPAELALTAA
ncbi:MAG: geranyltranstransferase [Pseudomonadota bacterium]